MITNYKLKFATRRQAPLHLVGPTSFCAPAGVLVVSYHNIKILNQSTASNHAIRSRQPSLESVKIDDNDA